MKTTKEQRERSIAGILRNIYDPKVSSVIRDLLVKWSNDLDTLEAARREAEELLRLVVHCPCKFESPETCATHAWLAKYGAEGK